MKGPYPGWDKDLHFVRSDDLFQTQHQKLIACGNQFEIVAHRVSRHSASHGSNHGVLTAVAFLCMAYNVQYHNVLAPLEKVTTCGLSPCNLQ